MSVQLSAAQCSCVLPHCLSRVCDVSPGLSRSSHEAQRSAEDMRAGSPLLSAARGSRRSRRSRRSPLRGFKSPAAAEAGPQVPVLRLRDMNMCYRLLRRLVPGLPPGRAASRVEILQHVIDYILQLQTELDAPGSATGDPLHQDRPQNGQSSGTDTHTCQVK